MSHVVFSEMLSAALFLQAREQAREDVTFLSDFCTASNYVAFCCMHRLALVPFDVFGFGLILLAS